MVPVFWFAGRTGEPPPSAAARRAPVVSPAEPGTVTTRVPVQLTPAAEHDR
jgi:hypothetical protein